jgi:putative NADH-flavin reductase
MNNLNESRVITEYPKPAAKNYKNATIGVLAFAVLGLGGYMLVDKNKTGEIIEKQQTQIAQVIDEKSEIQKSFDESLVRLDSMSNTNADLNNKLEGKTKEISKAKSEIRSILNKRNATTVELSRAKELIASLNETITSMQQDVARLTQENQTLTQEKVVLIQEKEKLSTDLAATTVIKEDLTKKVEVASTLNASNIAITPVNIRKNEKEKVTSTAKRVDKLVISFDVNNRIAEPGTTDLYVLVTGPDGKLISEETLGSGTFTTREEGDKLYTTKLPVTLETATKKTVEFAFTPGADFMQGSYKIQIYQNGFMIGEGARELKKGGLFS